MEAKAIQSNNLKKWQKTKHSGFSLQFILIAVLVVCVILPLIFMLTKINKESFVQLFEDNLFSFTTILFSPVKYHAYIFLANGANSNFG